MCSDENNAPNAERYLNAQLAVLHENSLKCLEEHDSAGSDENSMSLFVGIGYQQQLTLITPEQYYALAEFTVQKAGPRSNQPTHGDIAFQAKFDAPTLKFICDHDALLHFVILKGARIAMDNLRARGAYVVISLFQDLFLFLRP